jgi:hypothetical protein
MFNRVSAGPVLVGLTVVVGAVAGASMQSIPPPYRYLYKGHLADEGHGHYFESGRCRNSLLGPAAVRDATGVNPEPTAEMELSRTTVLHAFQQLTAEGYLERRIGHDRRDPYCHQWNS